MEEPSKGRILLVEDSTTQGLYYSKLLQVNGYGVEHAENILSARRLLSDASFDLVLMDLILSDEYGLDLLQEIRDRYSSLELPVIVFSVANDASTRGSVLDSLGDQANDFIPKGTHQDDLLSRLQGHIHLKKLNQQLAVALEENRSMAARARNVREHERRRMARELHEGIMQMVVSVRLNLAVLAEDIARGMAGVEASGIDALLHDLDDLVGQLRFFTERLGAVDFEADALIDLLQWWPTKVDPKQSFQVVFEFAFDESQLAAPLKTCIYRIVQEAITNCVRHSQGRHIWVRIQQSDDRLHIKIDDDGTCDAAAIKLGQGLHGMRERAISRAGALQIEQSEHGGLGLRIDMHVHEGVPC